MRKAFSLSLLALTLVLPGCGSPALIVSDNMFDGGAVGLYPDPYGPQRGGIDGPYTSTASYPGKRPATQSAPREGGDLAPQTARAVNDASARKTVTFLGVSAAHLVLLVKHTQKLHATVTYADGTRDGDVTWTTTDDTIIAINPTTGEASGVRPGIATLQVRSAVDPTKFANITVTVREGVVEDLLATIAPAEAALHPGDTTQLQASITNSSTRTHPNGNWTSSNQKIAYVNQFGLVTALRPGRATITFTSDQNSTVHARSTVIVADPSVEVAAAD